jgi:energy-coupling factor transporter transmembrane protein EcfT
MRTEKARLGYYNVQEAARPLGTYAYLAVFAWSIAVVMLAPGSRLYIAAGLSLVAAGFLYPSALKRLLHLRWLILIGLLVVANTLWLGERDSLLFGALSYSSQGLVLGLQMALRALVVLVSVDGLSSSVDISEVAGLLERTGIKGLGFSLGIAFNLLPALRGSAANAWHSLWMRGGMRRKRWRALQLLAVTIVANALRRGEEIALAAETRAFRPEFARSIPIKHGKWDLAILVFSSFLALAVLVVP